ncbi:MAG: hypothetical protein IBX43_04590 [Campylobacterales bacterium]|nr:hypothetical protein [Campylobacterales bacterium]
MPTEIRVDPVSFLKKCLVYWKTRDYGRKIEHVALLLSVAIYMNRKIYEEELASAHEQLMILLEDEDDVNNVIDYIKIKLGAYQNDNKEWMKDRQEAFDLITKNENLYGYLIDIFHADKKFDPSEELFEKALKRLL